MEVAKMDKEYLDNEEKELIEQIQGDGYVQPADMKHQMETIRGMAIEMSTKKVPLNIRLLKSDIEKIKAKALHEGIPYQTLIGSIVHKFANDRLR
jgi:predicted DNA binding CopG/RHH family protein